MKLETPQPSDFDPYYRWLGIPKRHRPPNHYQLLGISPKEEDHEIIEAAIERQTNLVKTKKDAEHEQIATRILYEIQEAGMVVLDSDRRKEYDASLAQSKPAPPQRLVAAESSPSSNQATAVLREELARQDYAKWTTPYQTWARQDWLEAESDLALDAAISGRLTEAKERIASLLSKLWEAERRLVAERFSNFLEAAPDAVVIVDQGGKIVQVNGQAERMFGYGREELMGQEVEILMPERFRDIHQGHRAAFVAHPSIRPMGSALELWGLRKDGSEFPVEINLSPIPDHDGILVASIVRDVTEQRRMAEALRDADRNKLLLQEYERRIGREIQQGFLPKTMPRLPGLEISGRSLAPNVVGGDCFDFIPLPGGDRECLGVLVADASGHGIGAALLTVETRAYLRGLALTSSDIGILLDLTNKCLCADLESGRFVTAFLMRLDPSTRSLNYSSAGHKPGYVLDRRGQTRTILRSTGFPLGIDPLEKFPASPTMSLEPGDLVLLNTDGIIEAASPDGELFGMERTLRLVRQHQQQMPNEILTALFDAVGDFSNNNFDDDLTAVIIKADDVV
jgi:PAS domain S-box-containing protein